MGIELLQAFIICKDIRGSAVYINIPSEMQEVFKASYKRRLQSEGPNMSASFWTILFTGSRAESGAKVQDLFVKVKSGNPSLCQPVAIRLISPKQIQVVAMRSIRGEEKCKGSKENSHHEEVVHEAGSTSYVFVDLCSYPSSYKWMYILAYQKLMKVIHNNVVFII
ncbi:hypothetical protein PoB_000688000 [Plakobranchus ocellatus]|uniref:Uncharacterized protein n=1 Tax=Plakobranchus ocellatus TaxID=259542 RepID=A0AAV3YBF6_9GAST|nr:hypothetical protein PoB_000688000 [Plakobranchus ocellatus]